MKKGLLIVNLGSPDAANTSAVRKYLKQFLSDPRVLDINPIGRFLLLNLIILPFRSPKSAHAYQQIWTEQGSPLIMHGKSLTAQIQAHYPQIPVELAMRYGNPSIESAIDRLIAQGCDDLIVFPLYPQYASSTTGSSVEEIFRVVNQKWNTPFISVIPPYYDHTHFLKAWESVILQNLDDFQAEHFVFSFHGLPERHVKKSDQSADQSHCLKKNDCCESICPENRNCYSAQCFATAKGIAQRLNLQRNQFSITFQSRLGRDPWLGPATDDQLLILAQKYRKIAVICPAFTADCLETLEEIAVQSKEKFEGVSAEHQLKVLPSLNSDQMWVEAITEIIHEFRDLSV